MEEWEQEWDAAERHAVWDEAAAEREAELDALRAFEQTWQWG